GPRADGVEALLEPRAGVGPEAEARGGLPHAAWVEAGRLEEDRRRVGGHAGADAPHHARDRESAIGVGDHEVVRVERPLGPVERRDALAGGRPAHAYATP